MVRLREHLSYGGLVLAALATVTACHPNAPPVASSVSSPQPQEQAPSVPSAAAPKTVVEPAPSVRQVESAPLDPPWNPVSSGETFNDRPAPTLRDWTSSSGAFHAGAKFAGLVEGQVQLNKAAGGQVLVPLDKLSVNDRKYIKELIRVDPTANVIIGKVFRVMDNRRKVSAIWTLIRSELLRQKKRCRPRSSISLYGLNGVKRKSTNLCLARCISTVETSIWKWSPRAKRRTTDSPGSTHDWRTQN